MSSNPDVGATFEGTHRDGTTLLLLIASLATAVLAISAPLWWRDAMQPLPFWLSIGGGAGLVAAGFISSRWRSARYMARLILLSSILYFIQYTRLASWDIPYTVGLLMSGYWTVVAGHFIVAFPDGRLRSRLERVVIGAAYAWATLIRVMVLFADERVFGCDRCPRNLLLLRSDPEFVSVLQRADSIIPVFITSLVVVVLIRRWRSATNPERRVLNPVFASLGFIVVATASLYAANGMAAAGLISIDERSFVNTVQQASLLLLPVGLVVGQLRSVLARSSMANLLVRIGEGRTVADLERDIAWVLGDPSVRIASDADSEGAAPPEVGRVDAAPVTRDGLTTVGSVGDTRVTIVHDPSLRRYQSELLDAVAVATRVALENQRLQAEATLTHSVPAGLAERLQREGRRIGDVRTMTISVLMSDIRGYATIAETAELRTLALQLHQHRVAMNRAIATRDGVVMQFVGDAVFAVFGAPEPMEHHALVAVQAARDMQIAQRAINQEWQLAGVEPFRIGIGVTTGQVAAALLGSSEHVEYSVVGDVVNLAQRLQSWAADGDVVIDQATFMALSGSIDADPLPVDTVKGRRAPVNAYRIAVPQSAAVRQPTVS